MRTYPKTYDTTTLYYYSEFYRMCLTFAHVQTFSYKNQSDYLDGRFIFQGDLRTFDRKAQVELIQVLRFRFSD